MGPGDAMIHGSITAILDDQLTGWLAPDVPEQARRLELVVAGEGSFGPFSAVPAPDGTLHFSIPLPDSLRDGHVRFLDVRPLGQERPLAGGPLVYEGGLFDGRATLEPQEAPVGPAANLDASKIEGAAWLVNSEQLEGWAWCPDAPSRRLTIELWSGERTIASAAADRLRDDLEQRGIGDGRYGFGFNLSALLRRGPHDVTVEVVESGTLLPGGRLTVGPFSADGEVHCPGYFDDDKSKALLEEVPLENLAYAAGRMATGRIVQRMINRLRRERLHFATGADDRATLLLLPGATSKSPETSIWRRQSYPAISVHNAEDGTESLRKAARAAGFVFFAGPGDTHHPSSAGVVMTSPGTDVVTWNRFIGDESRAGSPGTVLRRPQFEPFTWRHGAVTDTTIAVRGAVLADAPEPVIDALCAGRLHPLYFWLAGQGLSATAHPEALTSGGGNALPTRLELEQDRSFFADCLAQEGGRHALERTPEDYPVPFVMLPVRRAKKVSVIVCFRDKPELTLRCIQSLARQHITGELELVLVDNQSVEAESARILRGSQAMLGESRVSLIRYDAPFNHSAQNNLGVQAATGEVVLFCNNDVIVDDHTAVEQLAAWALQDGIGAVGCRLDNPDRGSGSYGLRHRPNTDDPFRPPLEESSDPAYSRHIHACPGATLALAAMARDRFLAVGGLDQAAFPAGYNDMDLMFRSSQAGLIHLYLGHVHATHRRGSSRIGEDEDLQVLRIHQRYPAEISHRFLQLSRDRVEPLQRRPKERNAEAEGGSGGGAPKPRAKPEGGHKSEQDQRAALDARLELEARRAQIAETLRAASQLSRSLADELAAATAIALND